MTIAQLVNLFPQGSVSVNTQKVSNTGYKIRLVDAKNIIIAVGEDSSEESAVESVIRAICYSLVVQEEEPSF